MTDWTTTLYALVSHGAEPLVLAQRDGARDLLPRIQVARRVWASATGQIASLFAEALGVPVHVLRCLALHTDEEAHLITHVHLLELHMEELPADFIWIPVENILEDDGMPAAIRAGLRDWQAEQRSGRIPERRAPWATPGWSARAERWIVDQVAALGRGSIINIEPVKSWSISCVWRVNTASGIIYFKATRALPLWVNEGQIMARLAEIYPGQVPVPLAMDIPAGWMLLDDFGNVIDEDTALDLQVRMMQTYARLQIDSAPRVEALLAAGCKDRRIPTWNEQLAILVNDDLILEPLKPEERAPLRERFITRLPRLKTLMLELDALPIPPALVHGDLHSGNVVFDAKQIVFFDWTDAAVSHPFIDMLHIFQEEDGEKQIVLREAYLAVWEEAYPKDIVRRVWALAQVLFGLYHAISYYYIVHGIEPSTQLELNAATFYLQFALNHLEKYDEDKSAESS